MEENKVPESEKRVKYLIVDTTAFIQNTQLRDIAENIITCQEVVDEITNKRQLRRLAVLPYDLVIKHVFPENTRDVTQFSIKTGDYPCLSATDIKVIALTLQLEKEINGTEHLRKEPVNVLPSYTTEKPKENFSNIPGFYFPKQSDSTDKSSPNNESYSLIDTETATEADKNCLKNKELQSENVNLADKFQDLSVKKKVDDSFETVDSNIKESSESDNNYNNECDTDDDNNDCDKDDNEYSNDEHDNHENGGFHDDDNDSSEDSGNGDDDDDDDEGWITPSNVKAAKQKMLASNSNSELVNEKVAVACMTTDFAMQNVLRQMNLNVAALDGRIIKQLRTYIFRCYACFKLTTNMTLIFCPKCGNNTLKRVAFTVDENGRREIYINTKRPLSARGKKFSLPKFQGGKHPNNPLLVPDQPMPDNRPSRLARTKTDPMDDAYVIGYSPFVKRDVGSRSAHLGIRPGQEFKYWMKRNPNESSKKKKQKKRK